MCGGVCRSGIRGGEGGMFRKETPAGGGRFWNHWMQTCDYVFFMGTSMMESNSILIVEDDRNVAEVLQVRLISLGYRICDIARSGQDAIVLAIRHRPDLILMDIMLEGNMEGIEASEQITRRMDVPIVFITCLSDQRVLDRIIKTHPYGYILKPYNVSELRYSIEIALIKFRAGKERESLITQLESALAEVKRLSGLLPICSSCKKIRDENGEWHQIESYIHSHSEADFSHSICPECKPKVYPELYGNNGKVLMHK